jgi:O-antigen/teichoic acid export membrane protein
MIALDEPSPTRRSATYAGAPRFGGSLALPRVAGFARPRLHPLRQVAFSMADQALSVGAMFLVNLVLARIETREEYGLFALSYSVLVFLMGLHNAAILEPFTVYGSGRYRSHLAEYFQLICWSNAALGLLLTAALLGLSLALHWIAPNLVPRAMLGLGLTVSVLLSGTLLRRVFYLQRRAGLAAAASLIFFLTVGCGLGLTARAHVLGSISVFLVLAAGWLAAGAGLAGKLPLGKIRPTFLDHEPDYWREHWKYARWVLVTAFVFQLTTQGYYWLVAGLLSVKDVAELKAVTLVVAPADQIFIALNYLVLPLLSAHYAARKIGHLLSAWRWYAIAITTVTVSFFLFIRALGRPLIHLLYGGRYDDMASLLSVLVLVPVVMGVGHTMNAALKAAESPKLVFWAYVASGAVTFIAGVPLVARFGLRGAAYGMLLSGASYTAALTVGFAITFRRKLRQPVAAAAGLETGAHA